MKRSLIAAAAMVVMLPACGGGGGNTRTVLVDYSSDRYANFSLFNFPRRIVVEPGMTVVFRQSWSGEPHTVTGGLGVKEPLAKVAPLLDIFVTYDAARAQGADLPNVEGDENLGMPFAEFARKIKSIPNAEQRETIVSAWNEVRRQGLKVPDLDNPGPGTLGDVSKVIDEYANKAFESVPFAFGEGEGDPLQQNYAQPCFLKQGMPGKDPKKPCSKSQQVQPAFDGTQSFYSSGIIRYQGAQGNTFRVPLSKNIKPGTYTFYCAVHGPQQKTDIVVREKGAQSQEEITRESRKEIDEVVGPLDDVWSDAKDGNITLEQGTEKITLAAPFVGLFSPKAEHAAINEFVPKTLNVKANAPIAWKMMGADHTVSFGVPPYFPPVEFLEDGTVRLNPKLEPAAGGARPVPKREGGDGPPSAAQQKVDGGTYDGTGFWSSGLIGAQPYLEYTMRISKPGTYRVACLIHPAMVGNVVVTP